MFYCCGVTDKGIMPHNEDAMLIGKTVCSDGSFEKELYAPFMTAVSDGVSGESSGEVASRMCLEKLMGADSYRKQDMKLSLYRIHRELAAFSETYPQYRNMQATLCGIAIDRHGQMLAFNVGDSRLYRYREHHIKQITRDQTFVQLLYKEGSITAEERKNSIHRNIIMPAFGCLTADPQIDVDWIKGSVLPGDIFLLCTDGLSDYVSAPDIQDILEMPKSLMKRTQMLVNEALRRGGRDNVTAITMLYTDE